MDSSKQMELKAKVDAAMAKSGELDRLKDILKRRLSESGWREEIKIACNKIIQEKGVFKVDLDTLVSEVTPIARGKVPDAVKKELLELINVAVRKQLDVERPSGGLPAPTPTGITAPPQRAWR